MERAAPRTFVLITGHPYFNEEISSNPPLIVIPPPKKPGERDKNLLWTKKKDRPYRSRMPIVPRDRPSSRRKSKFRHAGCHQCAILDDQYESRGHFIMHEHNGPKRMQRALTCPRMRFAVLAWIARDLHRQMLLYDQATIYHADYRQEYAPGPYIRSMPVYEPWHRYFKARYGHAKVGDESSLGLTEYYDKLAAILMSAAVQHGAQ